MTAPYRSNTHGPAATALVEADYEGGLFKLSGSGAIITGTQSSALFTADATCGSPIYRPDRLQREVDILAGLWGLANMQREAFGVPFYCATAAGSTTTVIQILEPTLPTIAATANHILYILDSASGPKRPPYLVASTTGTTITLTGAMSEAAPAAGVRVILVAKRKLLPNATDFPNPSIGFTDGTTQGVIEVSTRKIWRATAGTDLTKIASGSGTIELLIGGVPGNAFVDVTNKPQGDWDFTDATSVQGLPSSAIIGGVVSAGAVGINGADFMASVTPGDTVTNLGTGTPDGTTFLRGDGTWAVPGASALITPDQINWLGTLARRNRLSTLDVDGLGTLATQSGTFSGTSSGTNTGDQTITLSGDVSGSGTGAITTAIGAAKVTSAMLRNSAGMSLVGRATNSAGVPADIAASSADKVMVSDNTGTSIGWGRVASDGISTGAVISDKLDGTAYGQAILAAQIFGQ